MSPNHHALRRRPEGPAATLADAAGLLEQFVLRSRCELPSRHLPCDAAPDRVRQSNGWGGSVEPPETTGSTAPGQASAEGDAVRGAAEVLGVLLRSMQQHDAGFAGALSARCTADHLLNLLRETGGQDHIALGRVGHEAVRAQERRPSRHGNGKPDLMPWEALRPEAREMGPEGVPGVRPSRHAPGPSATRSLLPAGMMGAGGDAR